jgi:hypothetical protein
MMPHHESPSAPSPNPRIPYGTKALLAAAAALGVAAGALLFAHRPDPFYARNAALIRILDGQDARNAPGALKYVVRGGSHLFYLEDVRAAVSKWPALEANVGIIAGLSQALRARGVRLLVVPVPTKAETYPELLGGPDVPDVSPSKDRFLQGLRERGVECLDLRAAFYAAKRSRHLFPRTDTHWDQDAILLAADSIAARIGSGLSKPEEPGLPGSQESRAQAVSAPAAAGFPVSDTVLAGFRGDLPQKFSLPESDTVLLLRVLNADGGPYAEPDSARVLLYGDSFLNQYKAYGAHLGAQLSRALGEPVLTRYSIAGFTAGPKKIQAMTEAMPGTRVAVWVFTSRTLLEAADGARE